ncbi:MAG: hypothetical protein ACRCUA_06725 [Fusobacteriaceae bacterium]
MSKFFKNRDPFKGDVVKKINEYRPVANYDILEIDIEEKKELIECEKNIIFHQQKTAEHLMAISETLYKAQHLLANHGTGNFGIWFEDLGLKKDFVYMCLKRYSLYLHYENETVMSLPEKIIKEITKENTPQKFQDEDIIKILEAEKPAEIIKKIKFRLSGCPTNEIISSHKDRDGIVVEIYSSNEELKKEQRLKAINVEIKELEKKLESLKKEKKKIEKR